MWEKTFLKKVSTKLKSIITEIIYCYLIMNVLITITIIIINYKMFNQIILEVE